MANYIKRIYKKHLIRDRVKITYHLHVNQTAEFMGNLRRSYVESPRNYKTLRPNIQPL